MAPTNVEVVRRAWEAVTSHGELPLELWHQDVRIDNMPEWPIRGPYHGHEGLGQWREDLAEVIENLRFELNEIIDLGADRVLSVQRARGRAVHTGIEMDHLWASVLTLRDGKITYAQGYWTPEQAREAVGLGD